ncbi:uncharacterized protein TNCV_1833951 [Trichonephila clavipes]|nr:uncharacterized protein TNCV_1833951 [Trichonephila clavipes]
MSADAAEPPNRDAKDGRKAIALATGEDSDLRLIPEEESMDTRIKGNDIQLVKVHFKRGLYTSSTTLQGALLICYKQSPDNAHSIAFSQRSSSTRLIEDETFNDIDIMNNLTEYEDGQEEPDSLRAYKNIQESSFPTNWKSIILK